MELEVDQEPEEVEEVPETPAPVVLRQCTVITGDQKEVDPEFPIGLFEVAVGELPEINTSSIILIGEVEGRLVVAVPLTAWNRVASKRLLPTGSLVRPISVQAEFIDRAPGAGEATAVKKLWLGILAPEFEAHVTFDSSVETITPDVAFDPTLTTGYPTAESLAALFDQHFAFASATSGLEQRRKPSRSANPSTSELDQRLVSLEQSVASIATSLKELAGPSRPAALRKPSGASTTQAAPCNPPGLERVTFAEPEKEYDLLRAAREAGVPEEHIRQMAAIASKGKPKLPDFPISSSSKAGISYRPFVRERGGRSSGCIGGQRSRATRCRQCNCQQSPTLQSHIKADGDCEPSDRPKEEEQNSRGVVRWWSSGWYRWQPQQRHHSNPRELYRVLERNMEEDFQMRTQLPGSTPTAVSARAWLELRSRVQNYQTPVRLLWGIAGVVDCLKANQIDQARARCMLLLAMGDQLSIDRGNWLLAGEMSLEEHPPLSAFATHTLPTELEAPHTKLVDGRWVDLFIAKLNDYDNLADKKKRLGARRLPKPGDAAADAVPPKADPKKKGGGKGKGKNNKGDAGGDGSAEAGNQA